MRSSILNTSSLSEYRICLAIAIIKSGFRHNYTANYLVFGKFRRILWRMQGLPILFSLVKILIRSYEAGRGKWICPFFFKKLHFIPVDFFFKLWSRSQYYLNFLNQNFLSAIKQILFRVSTLLCSSQSLLSIIRSISIRQKYHSHAWKILITVIVCVKVYIELEMNFIKFLLRTKSCFVSHLWYSTLEKSLLDITDFLFLTHLVLV